MPASYAHYRFGKQVLSFLPADARQCVQRFRRMYDMGLQGPDIFFFYNPFLKTAVGTLDSTFHSQSGRDFFPAACVQATTEAARAYLYGLLAHYCLDSVSHAGLPHAEGSRAVPEAEFDRYLLELDSVPLPHTYDLSPKLKLTRGECMTVATFYPGATGVPFGRKAQTPADSGCTETAARKSGRPSDSGRTCGSLRPDGQRTTGPIQSGCPVVPRAAGTADRTYAHRRALRRRFFR